MKRGRFGIVLCFYPILAFAAAILKLPLLCALLFLIVIVKEKDEWAGRQTLQALMLSLIVCFFTNIVPWAASLITLPFFSRILTTAATVLSVLVYLAAIVFSILGIVRVMKDQEADLPLLSDLAYRFYGQRKPKPIPGRYPPPYNGSQPGQAPPQYQQPPQYGAPQQPYPGPQAGQNGDPRQNGPQG